MNFFFENFWSEVRYLFAVSLEDFSALLSGHKKK
jgi:hypothetical protein